MRKLGVMALGGLLCFGLLASMAQAQSGFPVINSNNRGASGPKAVSDLDKLRLAKTYGKLPLSFEVNRGQTDRRVKFLSRGSGYNLFLTPTEAVLVLHRATEHQAGHSADAQATVTEREADKTSSTVLRLQLVGANAAARISGLQQLPGKSNYFIGNDPKKWRTNVPNYGSVEVHDVYPGVDLMYYGNQRQLEDDFVVAPGADPRAVTMAIAGARKVSIDAQGELVIASPGGEVRLRRPLIYQRAGGVQHEIAGGYKLKGENRVGFELGEYDVRQPLIIDPVLVYSTYLGSGSESGLGIAVDSSGNAYVTGYTGSTNFPTTTSAFEPTYPGGSAFVTKLNPTGTALVYSTYLGSGSESGRGIAVDSSGSAYVTGDTGFFASSPFPTTTGAFQTTYGGGRRDAFVTKLNPTGSGLVYSTYLGGSGFDRAYGIAVDSSGNAYVTGTTSSTNFPTTTGAFQTTPAGTFVTKLNPLGTGLVYSTYLGGGGDIGYGIAVDSSGNAYVTGNAGFVTKMNALGTGLVYSTYLGPAVGYGIAVDFSGNAYVTGSTSSSNFPTTAGAFQTTFGGVVEAFVTELNALGTGLVYSTYLGGSGGNTAQGIAVDSLGNAHVIGYTSSTDFPTTTGAFQTTYGGGNGDAFMTMLNPTGSALVYSTYLGGSFDERGRGIAVDSSGNAYVTGDTGSANFPTTPGAFQTTGGNGAFVAMIGEVFHGVSLTMGPQAMEGNLTLNAGATLQAGYDFTMPGNHPTATVSFTGAEVTFAWTCVSSPGSGTLVVPMADQSYLDAQNSPAWYPSGDQESSLVYQGSIIVPNLCSGGSVSFRAGGTFSTGIFSTDTTDKVNVRWHYSGGGSAGGWSGTKSVVP